MVIFPVRGSPVITFHVLLASLARLNCHGVCAFDVLSRDGGKMQAQFLKVWPV